MKHNFIKILFSFLILVFSHVTHAQWGIKAGINYNSNGELKEIPDNAENIIHGSGDKSAGYHIGIIRKIDLPIMFIKPELVYTKTKSSYDNEGDFEMSKLIFLMNTKKYYTDVSFNFLTVYKNLDDIVLDNSVLKIFLHLNSLYFIFIKSVEKQNTYVIPSLKIPYADSKSDRKTRVNIKRSSLSTSSNHNRTKRIVNL